MNLPPMLERLVQYTAQTNPELPRLLQSGITPEQIYQFAPMPYKFPQEILVLYRWHNGTWQDPDKPEQELFYYHRFMPIQEAYSEYLWKMQFNEEVSFEVFDPHLFPIFAFQGEYYATWCADEEYEQSPVFFDYHGSAQVYDSLGLMITAITDCYDSGAYYLVEDRYTPDKTEVARIKAKWNMCRSNANGTILGYHP